MANPKCAASRCQKHVKPGAKYCCSACGYKTRQMHARRAKTKCAREACKNPIGPRSTKYCCAECRRRDGLDKALTNQCVECAFPIWAHATRCRDCANQHKVGLNMTPEARKKMSAAARARYGHEGKEAQVIALVAEGLKQAEVARRLGMCQGTVWAIVTFGSWAAYREFKRKQGAC